MSKQNYITRDLKNNPNVEHFLKTTLNLPEEECEKAISRIRDCSVLIKDISNSAPNGTYTDPNYRKSQYRDEKTRKQLRRDIIEELYNQERLNEDDDIVLGSGGGKPLTELNSNSTAYIITGLPASGKSSVANKVADFIGGYILDSDYAKRKLPEYFDPNIGAYLVHKESKALIFGLPQDDILGYTTLLEKCAKQNHNIVVPIIGDTVQDILSMCELLNLYKYDINLIHLSISRFEATRRALSRFLTSSRYVPLEKVFDIYGENNPTLTYYKVRVHHNDKIKTFGMLSADVEEGNPYEIIDITDDNILSKIYNNGK